MEIREVSIQQTALLGELSTIESELDAMLPRFMGSSGSTGADSKDNRFLKQVMRNPDMYETAPNREQVFNKALNLDENIKKLDSELQVVQEQMLQSERQHAKAADLYLLDGDEKKKA